MRDRLSIFVVAAVLVHTSWALVCPIPAAVAGTSTTITSAVRNKTCPDFKANPTFVHCCTSKLPPTNSLLMKEKHGVYCCSLEDFEKEKQDAANAELRNFLKEYLALIIFGSVLVVSLLVIVTAIVCKKIPGCPMYQSIHMMAHHHHHHHTNDSSPATTAMYRPVDQIPPKMYEAPPPYECFVPPPPPPSSHPSSHQPTTSEDWNCILENEANGARVS